MTTGMERGKSRPRARRLVGGFVLIGGLVVALVWVANRSPYAGQTWPEIQAALEARRWDEAGARLDQWLKACPGDDEARLTLATVRTLQERRDDARSILRSIGRASPQWAAARTLDGEIAYGLGLAGEAERAWNDAADASPTAAGPRRRLVNLLALELRGGEARERLRELYTQTRNPEALADVVAAPLQAELDLRGLKRDLEPLLRSDPADPMLRRAWGLVLLSEGRAAEARPHLDAAAEALEDDPIGRFARAECRLLAGDDPAAVARDFEPIAGQTLRSDAERARWEVFRGRLREVAGDDRAAVASYRAALAANAVDREAHERLAAALTRTGDRVGAAEHRTRADDLRRREAALRKGHEQARAEGVDAARCEQLAALCREAGLFREARAWLEQAILIDPTRASAQVALAALSNSKSADPFYAAHPRRKSTPHAAALPPRRPAREPEIPGPRFEDVAEAAGVRFRYDSGEDGRLFIADTMGGGVGLIDYDGDGRLDLYFVNGCRLPVDPERPPAPNRLYRNLGRMRFEDVTAHAGVGGRGYGMGCAVGDYDNDGHEDLFVTGFGTVVLYRNRGDGTFEDATARAGIAGDFWSTAAGWGDLDADGDLDLVVVTYVAADPKTDEPCVDNAGGRIHCSPSRYPAEPDRLYRNNGDGTFTEVGAASGIASAPNGRGLGLAVCDFDGDGRLDLFVANDASPNFLFHNLGGLRFEEIGAAAGAAVDGSGRATASMGVAADDLDGDGRADIFHTNFLNEPNTLRKNLGDGLFQDVTLSAGLSAPSLAKTGFGVAAADFDDDGLIDLAIADGHVDDQPWIRTPMAQRPQLYRGVAPGRFRLDESAGSYFTREVVGRGLVAGDLDDDGRVDLVVVHRDAPAAILRNITPNPGRSFRVRLTGRQSGHTPIGARVLVTAGGKTWTRFLTSGTGYLSQHDPRLHFGLGTAASIDRIEIRWPSGRVQTPSAGGRASDMTIVEDP